MKNFLVLSFFGILFSLHPLSAVAANTEGWAWGGGVTPNPSGYDGIGWISMNSKDCDADTNGFIDNATCGVIGTPIPSYAVNIPSDNTNLSGYAWSEHYGWISFNASDVSGCPSGACVAQRASDNITGWARIISICDTGNAGNAHTRDGHCDAGDDGWNTGGWSGWIDLSSLLVSRMDKLGTTPTYAYSDELGWIDFSFAGFGNTLTICEGPHLRKLIGGPNIPLSSNATTILTARYGSAGNCSDPVTSVTWGTENNPDDAISLPSATVTGDTVVVTANANNTPSSKEENVVATYNPTTIEKAKAVVTCPARTCLDLVAQTNAYCPTESRNLNNTCGGTVACAGTRSCNYNFKESSP